MGTGNNVANAETPTFYVDEAVTVFYLAPKGGIA